MSRRFLSVLLLCALLLSVFCQNALAAAVKSVKLDQTKLTVVTGQTGTLAATVLPDSQKDAPLAWTSSNEAVATVENGVVTGVSVGTCKIRATSENGKYATCTVTVAQAVESVIFACDELEVLRFTKTKLAPTVLPRDAKTQTLAYESSDKSVAVVVGGALYAKSVGECEITATATDGSEASVSLWVTVSENPDILPKYVALTFDDGPCKNTYRILTALSNYGAVATFFMVGTFANSRAEIVKAIADAGHELGNHTYDHVNLTKVSDGASQIAKCDKYITAAAGRSATVIRAPGGNITESVIKKLGDSRVFVNWSLDTRDWESKNTTKIYNKIMKNVKDGDIVLMHDLYKTTSAAVEQVLPELILKGFVFVTVSELMEIKGQPAQGTVYKGARAE